MPKSHIDYLLLSLELRLRRSIPLITDKTNKNRANNTRAKNGKSAAVMGLDMAEAKLLSGLMAELGAA
jgi:hypothetical protein